MTQNPDLWSTAITALVSACLGAGGIAPVIAKIASVKRQHHLDQFRAMEKLVSSMQERINLVEKAERECLAVKDVLLREIGDLRASVAALKVQVENCK